MKKRILSLLLATGVVSGMFAQSNTIQYTYADGPISPFGKGKKETYNIAICINDPALAGSKLVGFKAYINTVDGVKNPSMFLTKELKVVSKVNIPDIASYPVTPVATELPVYGAAGLMSVTLPEPYVLTDEPLYLGYTFDIDDTSTPGQQNPVLLSKGTNDNALFVFMTKSVLKWINYTEQAAITPVSLGCGIAYIVAEIEGDFPDYSLGFKGYDTIYAEPGKDFPVQFEVSNLGNNSVNSITYNYTYNDDPTVYTNTVELESPIEPSLAVTSPLVLTFGGLSDWGANDLNVTITEVNGLKNEATNASINCTVNVIPFHPINRPLVEEYTGLWCGWCPRGWVAMEELGQKYPDQQVIICYHADDEIDPSSNLPINVGGFPNASINRNGLVDPYFGTQGEQSKAELPIAIDIQSQASELAMASIDVEATMENELVQATATVKFIRDFSDANYRIGYVLVANGLSNTEWVQLNYYSGNASFANGPLKELTTWPASVDNLIFNDVTADKSAMKGIENSIPSSIVTMQEYAYTYSFDTSENALIRTSTNFVNPESPENLKVAAFVIDMNTGLIVNSNICSITSQGVDSVESIGAKPVVAKEYYDLNGRKVSDGAKGILIVKEKLSDGSVKTSKVYVK